MNTNDQLFWMMISLIVIAISFIVIAIAVVAIALIVKRIINTIERLEAKVEPLIQKANVVSESAVKLNEVTAHLATASKYFADSAGLIKEEIADLKQLVGMTAETAKEKVALVSQTIDRTQMQVRTTTDFIQDKVVEPAREIAAVMAGVRKGLEVLFAPTPKQIDRVYQDDELFIG